MKRKDFLFFIGPSLFVMTLLIAIPLIGVFYLSFNNSYVKTEMATVTNQTPFGIEVIETPVTVLDEEGEPVVVSEFVGLQNYFSVLNAEELGQIFSAEGVVTLAESFWEKCAVLYEQLLDMRFWASLEFTLLYTLISTPFILGLGFLLALGVNRQNNFIKGLLITTFLLPFIITPVVGSLSVKWLFIDNAIVTAWLESLGAWANSVSSSLAGGGFFSSVGVFLLSFFPEGQIYFFESGLTVRSLIILYGIWHVTPFAFIVLYAGLQTLPKDSMEAAKVDGAGRLQQIRYVVIPHLMPLIFFITLIHIMDAYRVFEPILVFSGGLYANSLQHLTYGMLKFEENYYKASASSLLTILGIVILLLPLLYKLYKDEHA